MTTIPARCRRAARAGVPPAPRRRRPAAASNERTSARRMGTVSLGCNAPALGVTAATGCAKSAAPQTRIALPTRGVTVGVANPSPVTKLSPLDAKRARCAIRTASKLTRSAVSPYPAPVPTTSAPMAGVARQTARGRMNTAANGSSATNLARSRALPTPPVSNSATATSAAPCPALREQIATAEYASAERVSISPASVGTALLEVSKQRSCAVRARPTLPSTWSLFMHA